VVFGTGRLFDNNEGPNVKLSFDGFRAIAEGTRVRLDLFAVKPVENNPGFFDDVPNHAESLWGSYLTVPAPIVSRGQADLYYIGLDTKSATYNRGTAPRASAYRRNQSIPPHRQRLGLQLGTQLPVGEFRERFDSRLERVNGNWIYV
jgi:Alginate export